VGTNPPPQEAIFDCPSNTNPCTDPSAHALQLTIPNVSATVGVTVLATEVPPSQADGLCESGNTVLNDFDCRFVTFFSDGTNASNNVIVPLCDPYANGNCVHYLVYSTTGGPGVEPPASSYSGGVYWQITWNNESFTPPAPYWSGSTPQLYDDPDYAVTPTSAVGTSCSQPMTINGVNQSYSCQFEFNITEFYNPTQTVDSGIGGSTKQFNDVVVAFPPTVAGTNPVVQPLTPSMPAIAVTCLTGCSITGTTINFTVGTGGTFQAVPTGYPAPTLTESGTLPNGLTINPLTGIVGGTPAPGSNNTYTVSFTATNSVNHVTQIYSLVVSPAPPPPNFTVTVTELGTGTGQVIDGQNLDCMEANGITTGTCSGTYVGGSMITFTANPTAPTTFGGWGGACASSGTSLACTLTVNSSQNVTANFVPPPTTVPLSFPVGTNPPPQEAVFNCPSHTNPCTDPSAHALQLTIPNVSTAVGVTVLATEVPPSQANGLCGSTNSVTNDFDCRFVTFFSDGTDANNNKIVPLCDPYANGNCVHYLVYSTTGGPGVEPPASSYSGGVYWQITWNNESFTPPAPYWSGSTPQLYDDPDYAVTPTSAVGTSCSQPMTINGVNQSYSCQFEFNITEFYNPTQTVDSGIGGSTKQFNDVVVAFPPTVAGTNPVVQPLTPSMPAIAVTCLTGCSITGTTINFTVGTGGTFQAVPTGYPAPTLTESGTLPNGLTINPLTGIVGGTPAPGSNNTYTVSFTATNSVNHVTQIYSLVVSPAPPPPNFTVTVTELGTGTGQVIDGQNLDCMEANGITTGTCSGTYVGGSMITFTANPTAPTTFGGWGGACASSGTSLACTLTVNSSQNVTANFVPPPTTVPLSFPVGTNPPPQEAVFNCPSHTNPCTDPSAHALQLTIPNVSTAVGVTVLATEVPPSQANGLCGSTNSVTNDFDCRFVTFFSDGTDANNNKIVPLCDPYANGNCVHYLVYSTTGGPGVEPPASSYSGGVYWQITWNNDSFTPPAPYWPGSTPQLYDDPDYAVTPTSAVGTSCTQPMTINGVNQSYSCQFEFNITEFYNPTQTVDSGIGGSTKQFNDVVVAFPPTVAGTGTVVQPPPTPSTPAITATCLTGCSITGTTINFTIGSGGTFQALPTGYPAPTLTETGALPNGLTLNKLTGIVGGTPTGTSGMFPISFTATNSKGATTQSYTLTVKAAAASKLVFTTSPVTVTAGSCSTVITAQSQDSNGNPSDPASTETLALSTSGSGGSFYSNSTCTTSITSVSIPTSANTASFYWKDTTAGSPVITASGTGAFSSAPTQAETVKAAAASKLVFTTSPVTVTAGVASGTITVQRQDQYGNANTTDATRTVTLSSSSTGTVTFTPASLSIASGSSSASFTYTDTKAGTPTITAASTSPTTITSASQQETVNAAAATLKIAPTSLNFGTVYYDQIGVQFVTLTNTGTTPITISSVKITTPGNAIADFGEITVCLPFIPSMPGTLQPGKTCTIAVGFLDASKIFSPTASTATIAITDNAAGSPQLIPLSLTVINPQASLGASSLSFATQKVGTTSASKTVMLTNTGNTPLTLGTLTVSGNFALVSGSGTTCSNNGTVAAGASCAINVTFKPTAKGNNTGSVKITDNALNSPQSISLSGTGN
jgi:hypothetical protein